jgi:hypothetical protein
MIHTALCHTVHQQCCVAKYLDFLIPISIRPYLTDICRTTVLLPCSNHVAKDHFKSNFSRSRHSACGTQSCICEMNFGDVCVCVCARACVWMVCGRPLGRKNLLSYVGVFRLTVVFSQNALLNSMSATRHGRSTVLYVWIDRCCDFITGREI